MLMARKRPATPKPDWPAILLALRRRWGTPGKPLSQAKAAVRVGVTLRSWAGWELGDQTPAKPVQKLLLVLRDNPGLSPPEMK